METLINKPNAHTDPSSLQHQLAQMHQAIAGTHQNLAYHQQALAHHDTLQWPQKRQDDWRYADPIHKVALQDFKALLPQATVQPSGALFNEPHAYIIQLNNGHYIPQDAETLANLPFKIKPYRYPSNYTADTEYSAVEALNHAFATSPIELVIPQQTVIDKPIYILNTVNGSSTHDLLNARVHITLQEASQACVIEHCVTQGSAISLQNSCTQVTCQRNAHLDHYVIQDNQNPQGIQVHTLTVQQQTNSHIQAKFLSWGGRLNRITADAHLLEKNAHYELSHCAQGQKQETHDVQLTVHHHKPNGTSQTLSRSMAKDTASITFTGKIKVYPNACKTEAHLDTKNIQVSPKARANSRPQLEIYNDDVKCSHGATTGSLDQTALFYMQSRGIPKPVAEQLLIKAFIQPVTETLGIPEIRTLLLQHTVIDEGE